MFDGVSYPVKGLLRETNTLVVKLDPALNWQSTVVFQ